MRISTRGFTGRLAYAVLAAAVGLSLSGPSVNATSDGSSSAADAGHGTGDADGPDAIADVLDTADLSASEDAWVSSARAGANFGGDNRLYVGERPDYGATRTLVEFKMSDLDRARAVTGAELALERVAGGPANDPARDIPIYRVDGEWDEGGVTWNSFPGTNSDRLATLSIAVGTGTVRWRSDKLTELVQRWRLPRWQKRHLPNRGLYIQGYETGGSHRAFGSSESSQKPKLRLTHERDSVPPVGRLKPVPRYFNASTADGSTGRSKIKLSWDFEDPSPASGVAFFRLYSQRNGAPLVLEADNIEADNFEFKGENGIEYGLVINAVDQAGNVEPQEMAEVLTLVDHEPPAVTAKPLPPFQRGPFQLEIDGGDRPVAPGKVNAGIAWYDVAYRLNGGTWAPLVLQAPSPSVTVPDPIDGATYDFHVRAIDKAGNEQPLNTAVVQASTTIDRRAPAIAFEPVMGISNPRFTVRWSATDPAPGASGVARMDVQFNVDGGPWTDWVTASTDTSRVFDGAFSHVYAFRGRAADQAGNQGAFPAAPQLYVGVIDRAILTDHIAFPLLRR